MIDTDSQSKQLIKVMSDCLNLTAPKSFFLFAGAGSGKTRALVDAMKIFLKKYGQEFRLSARKVAVITYTNAACDEIKKRIEYDSIFAVSTIHSFSWELIKSFSDDIREWLRHNLAKEINALEELQERGRAGTKAAAYRTVQIESKQGRRDHLETFKYFTYNPNGENIRKNSLNHAEVIKIAAGFLTDKPLMQRILIRKYPVLLIDESQDTQKDLVNAFFAVQSAHSGEFCLGLFGDTMQRIYADGKVNLEDYIPGDWAKPKITINYRCPKRIVKLINEIRSGADDHIQKPADSASEGIVRLFLVRVDDGISKTAIEAEITKKMAEITSDSHWSGEDKNIKALTLEHHMAASRGGFYDFFEPLYRISDFKTGLLDGTLSGISLFVKQILPLVQSLKAKNRFAVARIVKKYSPLLSTDRLKVSESSLDEIRKADAAVKSFFTLWDDNNNPSLIVSLKKIKDGKLFSLPDVFKPIVLRDDSVEYKRESDDSSEETDIDLNIDAWEKALSAPFSQLESYVQYISDKSPFGTHQGIKGLQFPRVMVVLDDNEARGFMFSYDKLFGAKDPTETDMRNEAEGKDTSIDRTRRLFYVTCSRAQSSLAVVVYTYEKAKIRDHLQTLNWFAEGEIIDI